MMPVVPPGLRVPRDDMGRRGRERILTDGFYPQPSSVHFSRSVLSDSATPWTAAHQVSLSITISPSLLKLTSIGSLMPSNHLISQFREGFLGQAIKFLETREDRRGGLIRISLERGRWTSAVILYQGGHWLKNGHWEKSLESDWCLETLRRAGHGQRPPAWH